MSDVEILKRAANGHWREILSAVCGVDPLLLDGKHHGCPKCRAGVDRFRVFGDFSETGGVICNQCFDQKNGDGISTVRWLTGANFGEALLLIAGYLQIDIDAKWKQNGRQITDVVAEIAKLKSIPNDSLKSFGAENAKRGKLPVCRLPMFGPDGKRCSDFDLSPIDAKWLKGRALKGKPTGLFLKNGKLPEEGQTIYVTEGPKDSAALDAAGFHAVGIPKSDLAVKFVGCFRGCDVVVVPDRDQAGETGARKTAARLAGVAASVRVAVLPGELKKRHGNGVREILALQESSSLLKRAIEDAVEWTQKSVDNGDEKLPLILTDEGKTDLANARRFAKLHGDKTRYCHPWSKWLIWDGRRWKVDDTGETIRLAKQVTDSIWDESKEAGGYGEEAEQKAKSFAAKTSSKPRIDAMLSLGQSENLIPVLPDQLDADPWLLNCKNGTLDLRTGELREHRQSDLLTKISPTAFDPDAESYEWDRFLESIFGNDALIEFVQRLLGYALTGDVSEQVLPIFYGDGANGKSTLLSAYMDTVGSEYTMQGMSDLLMVKRNDVHPTEMADLFGRRFVSCVETGDGRRLAESTVKQLTGGDKIRARKMREDFWQFDPTHKVVLCTNHKPAVRGGDHAIWRRLVLIPFLVKFWNPASGETGPAALQQDKGLLDKLRSEAEGVLAWAVRGCLEWQSQGLRIPETVKVATAAYKIEQDLVGRFVSHRCLTGHDTYVVKAAALYEAFRKWCEEEGEEVLSQRKFGTQLTRDFERKVSNGTWYKSIALRKIDPEAADAG